MQIWTFDHKLKLSLWPQSGIQDTNVDPLCVYSWGSKPHSNTCLQSFNVDSLSLLKSAGLMKLSATTLINCSSAAWSPSDAGISMKRRGRLSVSLRRQSQCESYYQEGARNVKPTRPILTKYRSICWNTKKNCTTSFSVVKVWRELFIVVPPLTNESSLYICLLVSTWFAIQSFNTPEMHTTAVVIVSLL